MGEGRLRRLALKLVSRAMAEAHPGLIEEMEQAGLAAALEKHRTYDPSYGVSLWTHAFPKVRGSMLALLYQSLGAPASTSTRTQWRIRQVNKAAARLTATLEREPTDTEIAWELRSWFLGLRESLIEEERARGLTTKEIQWKHCVPLDLVQKIKQLSIKPASLSAPITEDGDEALLGRVLLEPVEDRPVFSTPDEWATSVLLCDAVGDLPDAEREVIELHYGWPELDVVEIAAELQTSRQTVHARLRKGIKKLQAVLDFGRLQAEPYRPTTSYSAVQQSTRRRLYREACEGARLEPDGKFTIIPWLPLGTIRREVHDHGYPEDPIIEKPLPTDEELDQVRDRFFKPQ